MHVALMLDEARIRAELPLINRTIVGLTAGGIRVTRLMPETPIDEFQEESERRVALTRRIAIPSAVLPWMNGWRAERLAEALERDPPDLLLVAGTSNVPLACRTAALIDIPCAVEIWSRDDMRTLPYGRRAEAISAFIARTEAIGSLLREAYDADLVAVVPIGVAVPSEPSAVYRRDDDRSPSVVVIGTGRDLPAYTALLAGLRELAHRVPNAGIFLELGDENDKVIWRIARSHHLLGHLSTFQHAAAHRLLLMQCDVLVCPERIGLVRSILPEALARGIPVIAAADPLLDHVIDGCTARVVDGEDEEAWGRALVEVMTSPDVAQSLGKSAHAYVDEHHRSSASISRLADVIATIVRGDAYPLST